MENVSDNSRLEDLPSKSQVMALCSVFALEAVFITIGNLLTVVLFAINKQLRKKCLFLVINMAFADLTIGAVTLPINAYYLGASHRFGVWTTTVHASLVVFLNIMRVIFAQASLISPAMITAERFYAIHWPLKHRTLSKRAYWIVIFAVWIISIFGSPVLVYISTLSAHVIHSVISIYVLILLLIVCGLNIAIWRKFHHRSIASHQQNRATQNQRLTKTLLFASIVALTSWLPLTTFYFLIGFFEVTTPSNIFHAVALLLCYSNSFVNPLVSALRIPEFKQALGLCCVRRQAVINREVNEGRDNRAAVLTPLTQLRIPATDPSQLQLAFEQEIMNTKL